MALGAAASAALPLSATASPQATCHGGKDIGEVPSPIGTNEATASSPRIRVKVDAFPSGYLNRKAWHADESLRFGSDGLELWPPAYFPVQTLTVHHTAGINNDPDPIATVQSIYYYHCITQEWGDIGYHLLVDESGRVYEGRWSGNDAVPVFGPVWPTPQMVNAGHVGGFNAGNIGVALMGNFVDRQPTAAALQALIVVLATLAAVTDLDPLGKTDYVNPINGATRTVRTISGHSDWQPTLCPGDRLHRLMPSLRRDVARLVPRSGLAN